MDFKNILDLFLEIQEISISSEDYKNLINPKILMASDLADSNFS
jgi:hypothetical protein